MSHSNNVIILKNNQNSGIIPNPDELLLGEIAINTADAVIYTKNNTGEVVPVGLDNFVPPVKSVAGKTGDIILYKEDIGLSNVDNTSDINKPLSTAAISALASKSDITHNHSLPNENTNIGRAVLISNTSGNRNTAMGCDSLQYNTTGYNNTSLGSPALWQNINGYNNTSIGAWNMIFNTSGSENTSIGAGALANNVNGLNNVGMGTASLYNNTTGINNTSLGTFAGSNNTTGSNNTIIGFSANVSSSGFDNCIVLGANAIANKSGQFVLGSNLNPINTSATVGATGTASVLPSRPRGYLEVRLNDTIVKIPYYN